MRLPTYFLSHGGGPWPWMKKEQGTLFAQLEASLRAIPHNLPQAPEAVLVISGHWETQGFSISAASQPGMVFDYYGFPEHTYHISYPAPGSPQLADQVHALLAAAGLDVKLDNTRGLDHGTFTMLKPMYPDADVPVVQLSLNASLDPAQHINVGRLLAPLRDQGVLIIGSGLSYHNLRRMDPGAQQPSKRFDNWLQHSLSFTGEDRTARLCQWASAPMARFAHPREDHLIPLMVAVGAAENDTFECIYHQEDLFGSITASSFRFG
ncbi:class III extradiol ring-cleavage dioxygenase [Neptunomonas phycophila]|uniref:DODA-type extradiol aromatic ring-opening family dioxygenase n=1 Tax=Neptunomonas phycophila TaxID=1572645 RepID=UPI0026E2FE50|nr:class III extradiol ring-cleavage dioxygenase [Neptunomonas phycophila]MDO6468773.1 class III extradiol ring-cleavage dioxygenase [Neptunomonas phycophila]